MFGNNDQNFNNNFNNNNNNYNGNSIMNNNQNFNNSSYNVIPSFENNNQNMSYPGSIPNSTSYQNMMPGFTNPGMMEQTLDIPPVLEPIKPLSDTNNTVAPSMDALNPMNIMPETLPPQQPQTPLSVGTMESNNFNYNTEPINGQPNSIELNASINNNYTVNNPLSGEQINSTPLGMQSLNNYNQTPVNQPVNAPQMPPQDLSQPFSNGYNNISSVSSVDNQFNSPLSNDVPLEYPKTEQSVITTSPLESTETLPHNQVEEVSNQSVSDSLTDKTNNLEPQADLNEDEDYDSSDTSSGNVEISDIKLSDDNMEEDINNLGLDSSYTEPDMLEIMDLESPDETSNIDKKIVEEKEDNLETEENITDDAESDLPKTLDIKSSIEQLKKLIDKIKYSGIKIELEEFDFEEMYQLVIKINK